MPHVTLTRCLGAFRLKRPGTSAERVRERPPKASGKKLLPTLLPDLPSALRSPHLPAPLNYLPLLLHLQGSLPTYLYLRTRLPNYLACYPKRALLSFLCGILLPAATAAPHASSVEQGMPNEVVAACFN